MPPAIRPAVLGLLALLALATPPARAEPVEIVLAQGRYLALPPPGWDATRPVAATLLLHGAASRPDYMLADGTLAAAAAADGVLLLLPEGRGGAWAAPGSPRAAAADARDDRAFLAAVLDDARARFAIAPARLRLAGFSLGASMAFALACGADAPVAAVLTVGGVTWEPMPDACAAPPRAWMHVHGSADPTWPMAGRLVRGSFRQSPVEPALAMLGRALACAAAVAGPSAGDLACMQAACAGAARLADCRHPGGHVFEAGFLRAFHAWAEAAPGAVSAPPDRR